MQFANKFLAKGGVVYLTLPNEDSLPNGLADLMFKVARKRVTSRMMPFAGPYHIIGFTKKSVRKIAEVTGFTVEFFRCKYSYRYIRRYKQPSSAIREIKRIVFGNIHRVSDMSNNGMNMEVVLIKK